MAKKPWGWWIPKPDEEAIAKKKAANLAKQYRYLARKKAKEESNPLPPTNEVPNQAENLPAGFLPTK